jgi:Helix-turn-helix
MELEAWCTKVTYVSLGARLIPSHLGGHTWGTVGSLLDRKLHEARKRRSIPAPDVRRLLRINAGLTQDDVAEIVGTGRPTVTRWESGARKPQGRNALA